MSQITTAKIVEYDGCNMLIIPQEPISREMIRKQVKNVELRLCDGRECTSEQRRKIFAIIGEIADWSGHDDMTVKICVNTLHQIIVWIMTLSISAYPQKSLIWRIWKLQQVLYLI